MSVAPPRASAAADDIRRRICDDEPIDVALPGGGRLYVERPVPFLTLYRYPEGDLGYRLHGEEVAYGTLAGPASAETRDRLQALLVALSERFGGAMLLEVWVNEARDGRTLAIRTPLEEVPAAGEALRGHLDGLRLPYFALRAEIVGGQQSPAGPDAPFDEDTLARHEVLHLGLEVNGFFLDAETGAPDLPLVRELRGRLHRAFRQGYYDFVRLQTSFAITHFDQLGHRRADPLVWEIDRELVAISTQFPFLLLATATNDAAAYEAFAGSGFREEPTFHYRFLPVDPEALKRQLFNLRIDEVLDPTLAFVLRDKRDETFHMLDMLAHRGSAQFLYGSLQVFGGVTDELRAIANSLLTIVPQPAAAAGERVGAEAFAARCRRELDYLSAQYPAAEPRLRVREDLTGLMVSQGELNVGHTLAVPADRVEALVQHEIGTHVLTYWNGRAQPLTLLHTGTPGYEDLQEGLAVLSEWFVGGLTAARFRTLAARVVAIDHMLRGNDFVSTFQLLRDRHGIPPRSAFGTTARAYRGGGFTKDAVYLRGLVELLAYLGDGGRLEPLFIGKLKLDYVPMIDELTERGILRPAPLTPRWYRDDAAAGHPKLRLLENGLSVFDLLPRAGA